VEKVKFNKIIDASAHSGHGGGPQFKGYPLSFSRLGSSWLIVSILLDASKGCLSISCLPTTTLLLQLPYEQHSADEGGCKFNDYN